MLASRVNAPPAAAESPGGDSEGPGGPGGVAVVLPVGRLGASSTTSSSAIGSVRSVASSGQSRSSRSSHRRRQQELALPSSVHPVEPPSLRRRILVSRSEKKLHGKKKVKTRKTSLSYFYFHSVPGNYNNVGAGSPREQSLLKSCDPNCLNLGIKANSLNIADFKSSSNLYLTTFLRKTQKNSMSGNRESQLRATRQQYLTVWCTE